MKPRSAKHIDRLDELHRHAALLDGTKSPESKIDYDRLAAILAEQFDIPFHEVTGVLRYVQRHIADLGFARPPASLLVTWVGALLRERGYDIGDLPINAVEVPLEHVELNIFHPTGAFAGSDQNPEATSRRLAERIKAQFAVQRVYQADVVQAHEQGLIELMDLGAIDRPHDMFLTPDYVKAHGLPASSWSPNAGPAKHPDVLLAHLVRFTRELQHQFAGEIHWGFFNTLLLPFVAPMNDVELEQFCQQMVFEFAQLNAGRGGSGPRVTLDFDLEIPRPLAAVHSVGLGGVQDGYPLEHYAKDLRRFNQVFLDVLARGDRRGAPFLRPQFVFHLSDREQAWTELHQQLYSVAVTQGNPAIAVSDVRRSFGALGGIALNDADLLTAISRPARLRGFSISAVAINVAKLWLSSEGEDFESKLSETLELTVSAHRQKRMFISRLMAYGARGPLRFLRHRFQGAPFLRLDDATQAVHLIGLAEAARLAIGSPQVEYESLMRSVHQLIDSIKQQLEGLNHMHKLRMVLAEPADDEVAYRFAKLDMKSYGQSYSPYLLRAPQQAEPIYSAGSELFSCSPLDWRQRLSFEGGIHQALGSGDTTLYSRDRECEADRLQQLHHHLLASGVDRFRVAPDFRLCLNCYHVFGDPSRHDPCPHCQGGLVTDYGFVQSGYAPISTLCRGKSVEWEMRRRWDEKPKSSQPTLPLG